jgi:hypothetical protein
MAREGHQNHVGRLSCMSTLSYVVVVCLGDPAFCSCLLFLKDQTSDFEPDGIAVPVRAPRTRSRPPELGSMVRQVLSAQVWCGTAIRTTWALQMCMADFACGLVGEGRPPSGVIAPEGITRTMDEGCQPQLLALHLLLQGAMWPPQAPQPYFGRRQRPLHVGPCCNIPRVL